MAGIIDGLSAAQQLQLLYVGYFSRAADAGGFIFWENQYASAISSGQTAEQALNNIANSFAPQPETIALYPFLAVPGPLNPLDPVAQAGVNSLVTSIYHNLFDRAPDADGLAYWSHQLLYGVVPLGTAILAIANGATGADATLETNKVVAGLNFTTSTSGANMGFSTPLAPALLTEATNILTLVTVDPASVTAAQTATTAWIATGAGYTGTVDTLTTGIDTFHLSGNNGVVNGTNAPMAVVLQSLDVITGSGSGNVLNISDTTGLTTPFHVFNFPTAITISGIQTFNIATNGAFGTGGAAFDLSGFAGLTTANLIASDEGFNGFDSVKLADTTALNLTVPATDFVRTVGGSAVSVTGANGADVNGAKLASATFTGTVAGGTLQVANGSANAATYGASDGKGTTLTTVTLNNTGTGTNTQIKGEGVTTLNLNNLNLGTGAGLQFVTVNDAATGAQALTANLSSVGVSAATEAVLNDATATALTLNATGSNHVAVNAGLTTSLTIGGTGSLVIDPGSAFGALTKIDASANSGGVTLTDGAAGAVLTGSSGNDVVTLTAALTAASGGSINLGAGNNTLLMGAGGSIGAGVTVDGGTGGSNTISAALVNAGNASHISDFQTLDVSGFGSGAGNGALDTSLLATAVSGVSITAATTNGTATLLNLAADVTVTDTFGGGGFSDLTLTHAGAGPNSLTVNFAETDTAAPIVAINTLTSTADASISIASGGASTAGGFANVINAINETDNHLATVTITGAKHFDLNGVHTDVGAAITADTASSLTKIDASATTGGVNIFAGGTDIVNGHNVTYTGLTILGGTGGDTIGNNANNGVITEGATTSAHVNTLFVTGSGATVNDQASAGADIITLGFGAGQAANATANLGTGTGVTVGVANDTGAHTTLDTVQFGTGTATVTDNLQYFAVASGVSANTNGNILGLTGALHAETLAFAAPVLNPAGNLGAATDVSLSQTFDQAVFHANTGANHVSWFQYAGNTYLEDGGVTTATAEVVKIAGISDLSHTTVAAGHLTFA
jgi:S-layer protein